MNRSTAYHNNSPLPCSAVTLIAMATTTLTEDTCLNKLPSDVADALTKALDLAGNWQYLLSAVKDAGVPPLTCDIMDPDLLKLTQVNGESPTEKLLRKLGGNGYRVCHLRRWLRAKGLIQATEILGGIILFVTFVRLLHLPSCIS